MYPAVRRQHQLGTRYGGARAHKGNENVISSSDDVHGYFHWENSRYARSGGDGEQSRHFLADNGGGGPADNGALRGGKGIPGKGEGCAVNVRWPDEAYPQA